ncbi:MAG: glycosyltransferase [Candidatus Hodarchaeota archaeon]
MKTFPKKLVVFPNDPILAYYEKGEIKERYFNPGNLFEAVHLFTFTDRDVESHKVQIIAGDARLNIHPLGRISLNRMLTLPFWKKVILQKVSEIGPQIIRAYNPILAGFLGVSVGKELGIPTVISLHTNYVDIRYHLWRQREYLRWTKYFLTSRTFEPYVLRNVDKVICAYRFPAEYAKHYGAKEENIEVIYNRVDLNKFKPPKKRESNTPLKVLCVGRLIEGKNQETLIRAIKGLDLHLTLIGDGEMRLFLKDLVKKLGLEGQVEFVSSVPNTEIYQYYQRADIFALPIKYGGIAIPVIEAIASGLPIVVPRPLFEPEPELVGDVALVVENTPQGFREGLRQLADDIDLRHRLGEMGRKLAESISGDKMEEREKNVYLQLLGEM